MVFNMSPHGDSSPSPILVDRQQQVRDPSPNYYTATNEPYYSLSTTPLHSPLADLPVGQENSLGLVVPGLDNPGHGGLRGDSQSPRSGAQSDDHLATASGSHSIAVPASFSHRSSLGHRSMSSCSSISSVSSALDVATEALHPSIDFFGPAYSQSSGSTSDLSEFGSNHSKCGSVNHQLQPCESPFGMSRSISGLFIGTPDGARRTLALEEEELQHHDHEGNPPTMLQNHAHLLAMSHGHEVQSGSTQRSQSLHSDLYSLSAPPVPMHLRGHDGENESTPMPPSSKMFEGQVPAISLLHGQQSSGMAMPGTPSGSPFVSNGPSLNPTVMPLTHGTDSAHGTPASSIATSHSDFSSPFDSLHGSHSVDRLRRTDSIDSFNTSVATSPFNECSSLHHASMHGGFPDDGSPAHNFHKGDRYSNYSDMPASATAMARIASAPAFAASIHTPSRPGAYRANSKASGDFAVPTTPASATRKSLPTVQMQTPISVGKNGSVDLTPLMLPSTPLDQRMSASIPRSAPHSQFTFPGLESPVSITSSANSVGKPMKRPRQRPSGPPPLIVSSSDKVHVCWCGKKFKRMEHLKRHNKVHTQEKPFPCSYPGCQKSFGRSDNLSQHLKTHYRPNGFSAVSHAQLLAAARSLNNLNAGKSEAKHDPHAAATAAAAAAAAISANMSASPEMVETLPTVRSRFEAAVKRRSTISEGVPTMPGQHLGAPFLFELELQKNLMHACNHSALFPHFEQRHGAHQLIPSVERQPLGQIAINSSPELIATVSPLAAGSAGYWAP